MGRRRIETCRKCPDVAFDGFGADAIQFVEAPPGAALRSGAHPVDPFRFGPKGGQHGAVNMAVVFHGLEYVQGTGERHAFPVGAVFHERGKDIGHRHDARGQRELPARKAERVASAVQTLVVQSAPEPDILKAGDIVEQAEAEFGMAFHLRKLVMIEGAFLFQQGAGDAQLADIVKQTGDEDLAVVPSMCLRCRMQAVCATPAVCVAVNGLRKSVIKENRKQNGIR